MSMDRHDMYVDLHSKENHKMYLSIERLANIIPGARFRIEVSAFRGEYDVMEVELSEIVKVDNGEARAAYVEGEA